MGIGTGGGGGLRKVGGRRAVSRSISGVCNASRSAASSGQRPNPNQGGGGETRLRFQFKVLYLEAFYLGCETTHGTSIRFMNKLI